MVNDEGTGSLQRIGGDIVVDRLQTWESESLAGVFCTLEPWCNYGAKPDQLSHFFAREEPGTSKYCIRFANQLAGIGVVHANWMRGPYVQFLGLLPDFQSRGIGGRFLDWIEKIARGRCQRHVWIMASDFNLRARSFYRAHGYVEVAILTDVVCDGMNEVLMRKRL